MAGSTGQLLCATVIAQYSLHVCSDEQQDGSGRERELPLNRYKTLVFAKWSGPEVEASDGWPAR